MDEIKTTIHGDATSDQIEAIDHMVVMQDCLLGQERGKQKRLLGAYFL